MPRIHVFIGTKAQYIKTAPLLRLMDERGVDYRLIDSGQHARLAVGMRRDLGVREPDHLLGGTRDIEDIAQAVRWTARLATELLDRRALREEVFGGDGGVCVVHGDTPSTLLSTLMAKRAGLDVAHMEAGLRSHSWLHPFPEELVRIAVMRVADVMFAPDEVALTNLRRMEVKGEVVPLSANTSLEALRHALGDTLDEPMGEGPAIVTMHRVENLHRPQRVRRHAALAIRIARRHPVRFVVHGPTRPVLDKHGLVGPLTDAGVELCELVPHDAFARMLYAAPLVVTDGGSIQEECALLGVPTLLWRDRTERHDGLGANVVLSHYDPRTVDRFLAAPQVYRTPRATADVRPSEQILATIEARLAG